MSHRNAYLIGIKFDSYETLPEHLINTSKQVITFSNYYLNIQSPRYDWKGFQDAIAHQEPEKISFDKFDDITIHQDQSTVHTMVGKICRCLLEVFGVVMEEITLQALIEATFTNLKTASQGGFAFFNTESRASNTSFTYRVVFAFPNPEVPSEFFALVNTIKLTANIDDEVGWWGLRSATSRDFAAQVSGVRLVVNHGFIAPPPLS
ncbi:hypothetical protein FRC09_013970 [Ceratobasidium sp. 395]|nr:hypothetical protein FRC09_013970 [Ceratobasidium sp. 395]